MSFLEILKNRYSLRNFSDKPIPREEIEKCILSATMAPSACNKKPWQYIIIDDVYKRDEIFNQAFDLIVPNTFVSKAACIIVACAKTDFIVHKLAGGFKNIDYPLLDMGASIENLILEATDLGIGSCWIGWFNEKNIKKILNIPRNLKIVSLIALGYPNENEPKKEKNLDKFKMDMKNIFSYNSF
jgi:nitroreductase